MLFPRAYAASPKISALHACLADALTGKVIYEYNGSERAPMASTTKIMTAVLALENMDMSEIITVSENAARQEGSSAYFAPGDKVPAEEVIYGLMLNSGNDAAIAIAEHISGSSESFAELMNEKARQLGALDTNFSNPNGLDSQSHYTTAEDLAKITAYALKNDEFRKIVSEKAHKTDYSSGTVWFSNHNKLLNMYDGCIGVKTGFTKRSGRCLVSAAERGGITLICVTLNDPDDWADHKALLDFGFESAREKQAVKKGDVLKEIKTKGAKSVPAEAAEDFSYSVWGADRTEIVTHTLPEIRADIDAGEKIGYMDIISNGNVIGRVDLLAGEKYVNKRSLIDKIRAFIGKKTF